MPFKSGKNRYQIAIQSIDDMIDPEAEVRIIDAFVESLDLGKLGFEKSVAATEGRPRYNPKALLKLYIYGNRNTIRSSRKLQQACKVNIEVIWLMDELKPDFRTISDFRKDNAKCLKAVFLEFNRKIYDLVEHGNYSIDGSKVLANNSKDNNFTANKLDDRLKNIENHINEYMAQLDAMDEAEDEEAEEEKLQKEDPTKLSKEELQRRLKEITERQARYEGYLKALEESGASQLSLTDPESRLMKNKNGFGVSFNVQTAVDSETHMIDNFLMTNQATDHGLLAKTVEEERKDEHYEGKIIEVIADKGYQEPKDMMNCLENGIIPNVILEGKDQIELETEYEENECTADEISSTKPEDLKKCLRAGHIPEAYKDRIDSINIVEIRKLVTAEEETSAPIYNETDPEKMKARAAEGFFVRDMGRNLVYCPAGEILRQKSTRKDVSIVYANKLACQNCPYKEKCITASKEAITKWQEVYFKDKVYEKPCKKWNAGNDNNPENGSSNSEDKTKGNKKNKKNGKNNRGGKGKYVKTKVVRITFKPDKNKTVNRMCLSEHPFGTLKRTLNGGYFLLRGMTKTEGEFALLSLAYNLRRAQNIIGFDKLMAAMS